MKQLHLPRKNNRARQIACTVSAAALMLGVSHATTVAMHFQVNYCGYVGYTGFPVTSAAFGVQPSGWQNLTQMMSGYATCSLGSPYFYTLNETISTNTSSGGLNPLASGTINITWTANTANFSDFGGYVDANNSPSYNILTVFPYAVLTGDGEEEVYASFLRDGINFGPGASGGNNTVAPGYSVDMTGVKSVFTSTPYVVELIASSDSMQVLTNAFVIDVTNSISNSVTYPNTPPVVSDAGGAPWLRGHGGGLSTASATMNVDHLQIMSAKPAHGGTGAPPASYDMAGTISGFIITDQPVVTMSPNSVYCNPGDSVALSSYAIGVTPLHYQWRRNGVPILGANATNYSIASINSSTAGFYDIVVTNAYGSTTSKVATIADVLLASTNDLVVDSNPANPEHDGLNNGAAWLASSSDGSITRNGVMQFVGTNTNSVTVIGTTNFDTPTGSMMFWMRSAGTDPNAVGNIGAAVFGQASQPYGSFSSEFALVQTDGGNMLFNAPSGGNQITSVANISDNKWHLIIVTYDSSVSGGAALYVDGVLDTTNANSSAWTPPAGQPLQAGFSSGGGLRAYTGLLNDVRVYSRELTSAEVATIYSNGSLIDTSKLQMQLSFSTAPVTGLVLNWPAPASYTTTLQSSLSVNGTYTNVPAASLPYYVVPKANQRYFRYVIAPGITPQARVSNPYLM